jgi:hypothetical protein
MVFDLCGGGGGASCKMDQVIAHVGGLAESGCAIWLEVEDHEVVEALGQLKLAPYRVEESLPSLCFGLEARSEVPKVEILE